MHELRLRHGEDHIPFAIVVASMSILLANRYGSRGGLPGWTMLLVGSLIVAWPSADPVTAALMEDPDPVRHVLDGAHSGGGQSPHL
ncbi:hypothetical protein ABZ912_58060 [Nonomuraea angiospora]|uniref:hypothetical protein n=1 Tax=Nonomuraea angiospora TaxID=46172 RepID=UPI0033F84F77